jgi:hypothetical protein
MEYARKKDERGDVVEAERLQSISAETD